MTIPDEAVQAAHAEYHKVLGDSNRSNPMFAALTAALPFLQGVKVDVTDIGNPITLVYTNYRGETSERTITPIKPWFGSTEWHPEPQWLLTAFDHEKQANRDFALKDFGWLKPNIEKGDTFKGTVDGDTALQAAAREAGWALIEVVDEIDWLKREKVSDIISNLGIALNEPSAIELSGNTGQLAPSPRAQALEEAALLNEAKALAFTAISRMRAAHVSCLDLTMQAEKLIGNIETATRALSSQPVADGWLPIETAPKDGTHILSLSDDGVHQVSRVDLGSYGIWKVHGVSDSYYGDMHCNPTHWRPLPSSPGASATRPTGGSNHGE